MTACSEIGEKLIIFQFQASIESMQSGDSRMCYLTSSEVRTFLHFSFYTAFVPSLTVKEDYLEMGILGILTWFSDRKIAISNLE